MTRRFGGIRGIQLTINILLIGFVTNARSQYNDQRIQEKKKICLSKVRKVRGDFYDVWPSATSMLALLEEATAMSDRWRSPAWILKMFETYHDPCPIDYKIDAFSYDWCEHHDQVYVNPPYSDPSPWVEKAIEQVRKYPDSIVVMLLRHDSSTKWFNMLHESGAHFIMTQGRLDFDSPDGYGIPGSCARFPSVLAVLSSQNMVTPKHTKDLPGSCYQSKIYDYKEGEN